MNTVLSEIVVDILLPKMEEDIEILPPSPPPQPLTPTIISLPTIYGPLILHYGSQSGYRRFSNSYFAKTYDDGSIIKHKITLIKYNPDDLYNRVDGMAGKCWLVSVKTDHNSLNTYYIRNWHDIVEHYKTTHNMEFFIVEQYTIKDNGTWKQVIYSEEAKLQIKQYLQNYPNCSSTIILDNLFPTMQPHLKQNAAYEIQVVLERAYIGR